MAILLETLQPGQLKNIRYFGNLWLPLPVNNDFCIQMNVSTKETVTGDIHA